MSSKGTPYIKQEDTPESPGRIHSYISTASRYDNSPMPSNPPIKPEQQQQQQKQQLPQQDSAYLTGFSSNNYNYNSTADALNSPMSNASLASPDLFAYTSPSLDDPARLMGFSSHSAIGGGASSTIPGSAAAATVSSVNSAPGITSSSTMQAFGLDVADDLMGGGMSGGGVAGGNGPGNYSIIDESDLLDLNAVASPDPPPTQLSSFASSPPPQQQQLHIQQMHLQQQQQKHQLSPGAFQQIPGVNISSPGPASLTYGSGSIKPTANFGTTPPVPESTSPFDEFLLRNVKQQKSQQQGSAASPLGSRNIASPPSSGSTPTTPQQALWIKQQRQIQMQIQQQQQQQNQIVGSPAQYGMTHHMASPPSSAVPVPGASPSHTLRFLSENNAGLGSATSSPVGSYGSGFAGPGSGPMSGGVGSGPGNNVDLYGGFGFSPSAKPPVAGSVQVGNFNTSGSILVSQQQQTKQKQLPPGTPNKVTSPNLIPSAPASSSGAAAGTSSATSAPIPLPTSQHKLLKNTTTGTEGATPGSLTPSGTPHSFGDDTLSGVGAGSSGPPSVTQNLILAERRRRRRESHNAVERRRRDNINEKIQELATLVPEVMLYNLVDPLGSSNSNGGSGAGPGGANSGTNVLTKDGRPNKGTILTRSVDYIRYLQNVIDVQNDKEMELRELVQSLQRQLNIEVTAFGPTSAEIALAKIRGEVLMGPDDDPMLVAPGMGVGTSSGGLTPGPGVLGFGEDVRLEPREGGAAGGQQQDAPEYDSAMADEFLIS